MKNVPLILLYQAVLILVCKESLCQADEACEEAAIKYERTADDFHKEGKYHPEIKRTLRNVYLRGQDQEEIANISVNSRMDIDDCLCTGARDLNFFCISTNDAGNIFSFKYNGVAKFSLQDILKAYLMYIVNVNRGVNQNIDINKSTMDHDFQINMEAFKNFDINKIQFGSNTGNDVFDITGFLKYFNENNNNNQANLQIHGNNNVGFKHITTPHHNIDVNQNIINQNDVGGNENIYVEYDNGGGAIADDRSAVVNQVNQLIAGVFKSKSVINTNANLNSQIQEFINILINNLNQNQGYNSELIITSNYDIKAKLEALRQILIEATANGNGNVTVYTNGVQFDVQAALETIANAIASVEEKLRAEAEAKVLEQNNQVNQQNKQKAVVNQVNQLIASAFKSQTVINTNVDLNSKIQEFINILINNLSQNQGYNSELTVTSYFDIKAKLETLRQILIEAANGNGNFAIYTHGVQFDVRAALEAITNAMAFVESKLRAEAEAQAQEQTNQVNQQNQQRAVVNQVNQLIASAFKSQTVINTNVDLNSKIQEFINILITNLSQNQGYNSELTVTTYFDIKAKLEALKQILIEATANGNGNFAIYTNGVQFDVRAALEAIANAIAFVEVKLRAEQVNQQNKQQANIQIQSGKQSHSKNSAHHTSVYHGSSGGQSVFYGGGGYNFGQFGQGGLVGVDGGTLGVIGLNGGSIIGLDGSNSMGMGGGGSMGLATGGMISGGSMGMGGGGAMGMATGGMSSGAIGMGSGGAMGMGGGGVMGLGGGGATGFSAGGEMGFSAGGGVDFGSGRAMGMGARGAMGMGAGRTVGRGSRGLRGFNFGSMGYARRGLIENPPSDRYIEDSNYQVPAGHSLNK